MQCDWGLLLPRVLQSFERHVWKVPKLNYLEKTKTSVLLVLVTESKSGTAKWSHLDWKLFGGDDDMANVRFNIAT